KLILEPFMHEGSYQLQHWRLSERVSTLLGDDRWNFRLAGPASLILFLKAFSGICQYLQLLDVPLNWKRRIDDLQTRHGLVQTTPTQIHELDTEFGSDHGALKIQVDKNGQTKVKVTFGLKSLENLPNLIPDEVNQALRNRHIIPEEIAQEAIAKGYPKGTLFELQEGDKTIKVWLE
ncbi:MAG: hypothetical protein KDD62_14245, partial [Bdellovibrionales bacterium]|nr:hypothetical protein [Bdellovibrionales bacterium]